MKYGVGRAILAFAVAGTLGAAAPASAALTTFQVYTGTVGLSTDGWGNRTASSGNISASVPAGATVLAAYLYTATQNFNGALAGNTLNGSAVTYGPLVFNGTACCTLASARADVTSIVKPIIDAGPGGIYDFTVVEGNTAAQDGEALVVVYSLPSLATATVGILDGWASVTGDTTTMTFAAPLDPNAAGFVADMRLGINFSCCGQMSDVSVNGTTITESAGNNDDSTDLGTFNGGLITVGSFDDPFSANLPDYEDDHERYNLKNYINPGDTSITVRTINASADDNIFLATFLVSGEAKINDPVPEPGTLTLVGLGLAGLVSRRRLAGRKGRQ